MEDYQITPEIVCHCDKEIDTFCKKEQGLDKAGSTIHCLMENANVRAPLRLKMKEIQFRPECTRAVSVKTCNFLELKKFL